MFDKILIANRGEIAVRIIRTARAMGVKTVAVFSDADADAMHVKVADEAYAIGPAPATESYLKGETIIEVAKRAGAQAIHPGYGFLSENAGFARACAAAGMVFIGPRPETIEVMGSKSLAKDLMEKAGVPLSPGYQGEDQSVDTFKAEAARIGYPVLLKAAAGGGGKGMRIVEAEGALEEALTSAKREALSAFGDDRFLVEKFITGPRHVEVQVFGDTHGNVVHLYERDCSVQRRYQKVVEEAPAPNLPASVRERLLSAGVEAAKAVGYVGAGTVEFLYDGGDNVYFMEMNTRLQVEHPVTEEVTGLDLVEWQLRVAAGEPLPLDQDQIYCDGHAVEVRLYAEDPAQDYRPSVGDVTHFDGPFNGEGARVDTGIAPGAAVTPYYDPMVAKLIAHGDTRGAALSRLANLVAGTQLLPLKTNQTFLHRILTDEDFREGGVTTKFLTDKLAIADDVPPAPEEVALMVLNAHLAARGPRSSLAQAIGAWRLNAPASVTAFMAGLEGPMPISLNGEGDHWWGTVGDAAVDLSHVTLNGDSATAQAAGQRWSVEGIVPLADGRLVGRGRTGPISIELTDPGAVAASGGGDAASLLSPMPATVTGLMVEAGAEVEAGAVVMTLEAMKMEHLVKAPAKGVVTDLYFAVGDTVGEGQKLLGFDAVE